LSTAAKTDGRQRTSPTSRRNPFVLVGQITAVVTLFTGILTLVFIVRPGWQPSKPPDEGKAEVSEVGVVRPFTYGRYLQRLSLPAGTLSQQQLRRHGALVEFHYEITGFREKQLPLRWELNDRDTNDLVAEDRALAIQPSTNSEGRDWYVWVPTPKTERTYYVTVTIYQPNGLVPLKDFRSPDFPGLGVVQ
jgi:hypothetical protein